MDAACGVACIMLWQSDGEDSFWQMILHVSRSCAQLGLVLSARRAKTPKTAQQMLLVGSSGFFVFVFVAVVAAVVVVVVSSKTWFFWRD